MDQEHDRRRAAEVERDYEAYKLLLGLWQSENPIKTLKLQMLLTVNALLVAALAIAGGPSSDLWYVHAAGAFASLIWTFSIGRTSLFQDVWRARLAALRARHPGDARFALLDHAEARRQLRPLLRVLGGIPSSWYLLAAPIACVVWWLALWIASVR